MILGLEKSLDAMANVVEYDEGRKGREPMKVSEEDFLELETSRNRERRADDDNEEIDDDLGAKIESMQWLRNPTGK